jgi:enoyl-CoA hydratase
MEPQEVLVSTEERVLILTLNRPAALNALTPSMVALLIERVGVAMAAPEVGAIILTGTGRGFCAGADLKESEKRAMAGVDNTPFIRSILRLGSMLEGGPKPVIGAVNGIAVAGGLELLLACDFLLAASSARLGDAHSNYAMFPGGGATMRLPRRIGLARAKRLMLTGDIWSAEQALEAGLVDSVHPDEALMPEALALADRLTVKSPLVLARMKEALTDAVSQPPDTALRRERDLNELHAKSFDRAEGLAAFREKRKPAFQGR